MDPWEGLSRSGHRVRVIAHRGANKWAPENTAPAFEKAIELRLDFVEIDLRETRDGELISFHDHHVDRKTNGHGQIWDLTWPDISRLDAGSWFAPEFAGTRLMTLDEILALCAHRMGVYIDWKAGPAGKVVPLIEKHGMEKEVLVHADLETSKEVQALNPDVLLMPAGRSLEMIREVGEALRPPLIEVRGEVFSEEMLAEAARYGMRCTTSLTGRCDTEEMMRRVIRAGVVAIETDHPDVLLRVLEEEGA